MHEWILIELKSPIQIQTAFNMSSNGGPRLLRKKGHFDKKKRLTKEAALVIMMT